jgi:hypothetical protein
MTNQDYRPPVTAGNHETDSLGTLYLARRRTLVGLVFLLLSSVTVVLVASGAIEFRNTASGVDYVGSQVCAGCHQGIYDRYLKTGMGRSMSLATDSSQPDQLSNPNTIFQASTGRYFQVYRQGPHLYQSQYELDSTGKETYRTTHRLEYVVGSGANGQSFAVRREGALFQAPLSYYSRPDKWDLSPGFESSAVGFNRPILAACIVCHSGRANTIKEKNGFYGNPAFSELAIGCENCHGPGQLHVTERAQGLPVAKTGDRTIVNPTRLPGWLADNICMNCHQTGDTRVLQPGKDHLDFRPGTPLNDTVGIFRIPYRRESPPDEDLLEHYSSMVMSRCYRQSQGKMSCISCHSPHTEPSPAESPAYYRGKCLGCHTDNSCAIPLAGRLQRQPGNDCAGCHLPKRDIKTIAHSALSNHRILARSTDRLPETAFQEPVALPDLIHVNAVPGQERRPIPLLTQFQVYGELLAQHPAYQERYLAVLDQLSKVKPERALVLSALARKAKLQGTPEGSRVAMEYLAKAIQAGSTSMSDFQDYADLLVRTGQTELAVTILKQGIEMAPFNPLFYKTLTLQYIQQKNYAKALGTMKRHLELFPEDTFMAKLVRQVEASPKPQ